MSLFNPWVLLGILMAILSAAGSGYYKGSEDEVTRQQVEIAALNAKARETEQNMTKVANTYAETLRKSQNAARTKETKLRADVASGALRLSIPTQSPVCSTSVTPATTGDNSGETRTELSGQVSETLIAIASEGDSAIRKLNQCIQTYETLKGMK
jgi:type II secretory pathway pseudopilin PulG